MNSKIPQYLKLNLGNYKKLDSENFLWRIRNDPTSREFSVNSEYINFETHETWLHSKLQNNLQSVIYLCIFGNDKIGVVRFEKFSLEDIFEVSIILSPEYRGYKISENVLSGAFREFLKEYKSSKILAKIHKKNISSKKLFANLGFEKKDIYPSNDNFYTYVNTNNNFHNLEINFSKTIVKKNTIGIMQPTFLPWLGYFALMQQVDCFVLLDDVQLSKQSWQVRNRIKNSSGDPSWLTLPIKKHPLGTKINKIEISEDKRLIKKIVSSFEHNYYKTPFFHEASDLIKKNIFNKTLSEITSNIILDAKSCIGITTPVFKSSELNISNGSKEQRLVDIINYFDCNEYISPVGSSDYLEKKEARKLFKKNKINLHYLHFEHPKYKQSGRFFLEQLGIVDCVSNIGYKDTMDIINLGINKPTKKPVL
tara:strand:- start:11846 stop:13114 length:1269 start_codon:yes stop_codon:yes gene_type:complete